MTKLQRRIEAERKQSAYAWTVRRQRGWFNLLITLFTWRG